MKKQMTLLCLLLMVLIACKKQKNNAYSTWVINGQKHSANDVIVDHHRVDCVVSTNDYPLPQFYFQFPYNDFVYGVNYLLQPNVTGGNTAEAGFSVDTIAYLPSPSSRSYTHFERINGKTTWKMDSTWFVNYHNASDSVMIYGSFSEP